MPLLLVYNSTAFLRNNYVITNGVMQMNALKCPIL